MTYIEKNCKNCGEVYRSGRQKYCSNECGDEYWYKQGILEIEQKYADKLEGYDYVVCPECKRKVGEITLAHAQNHGYNTINEFLVKNSMRTGKCQRLCDVLKGDKNPAIGHGGKLSPFSRNFVKYAKLSEDEKDKKIEDIQKIAVAALDNNGRSTSIEYFTSRGYTEEGAAIALHDRQATFSLEKCIEKHGIEEGTKRWQKRQDKWKKSLSASGMKAGYSKISQELFEELKLQTSLDLLYGTNEEGIQTINKKIWVDCYYADNKAVIEFFGDYWHGNPKKYSASDRVTNNKSSISVAEIWEEDRQRIEALENVGHRVLIVWENDFCKSREKTINTCIDFLRGK